MDNMIPEITSEQVGNGLSASSSTGSGLIGTVISIVLPRQDPPEDLGVIL